MRSEVEFEWRDWEEEAKHSKKREYIRSKIERGDSGRY